MAVFENCSVLLELKNLPFKKKKQLKSAVTENGGRLSFVVNKQCSLIVTNDVSNLSSNRLRSIQKHQTPVVGLDYVYGCVKKGVLLPVDEYKLDTSSASSHPPPPPIRQDPPPWTEHVISSTAGPELTQTEPMDSTQWDETPERSENILDKFRLYTAADSNLPAFPDHFQVAKYSIFQKKNSNAWCVLELQSAKAERGQQYRVIRYSKDDVGAKTAAVKETQVFPSTSEEAVQLYQALRDKMEASGLQKKTVVPLQNQDLGSAPLQQLLLEERLNAGSLSQEVGVFVELLWTEALGCIGNILSVPINKLSLNDVSRAEGLLLQAQKNLNGPLHKVASLLMEFNTLLPQRNAECDPTAKFISRKLDLCQLIRDVLTVSEMTLRNPSTSCVGKYRALRCSIETVPPGSSEFQTVNNLLQDRKLQVQQVFRVNRPVELQTFKTEIRNVKPLLHSSSPSNFVGILSRGLLLPRAAVERHGIERTDVGNLGSGIYFSDALSTCLKYSKPSETDGSRLLLVCDVALGRCKDVYKRDLDLTRAPEGHDSVHGVRRGRNPQSEFEDDEYVVYSPDQVKLKYVVQFSVEGDELKNFSPAINTSAEPAMPPSDQELSSEVDGVENVKDPLDGMTAGLLDGSGQQLPLQAVHVKCKLMDLLSQVIIFQKYTNQSSVAIEAKYVFPLDDSAAVCGFEAFINGKHVVGQVKEKETARKEYKQAIAKGHGAYLMDQDAPDVFTISVGNLPPGATVLIKVTFVSELIVRDGTVLFSLPGSVAPWQESAALNQTTQVTVEKVCVTDEAASQREFTLDMSIEMPYEITSLQCVTHQVKTKRTDCKAVLSVLPGEVMGPDGFQLSVGLSKVHMPRMWVEKHPDKDSQACMLVFYPDFEVGSSSKADEVVLLLDTSESMKGEPLRSARRIALQVLKNLDHNIRVNVILFGTEHKEAFLAAQPLSDVKQEAVSFIKSSSVGGSTELWRPLRALSLLPPSGGVRNLLLLSDGHIQNSELSLKLLRDAAQHSRLFTCGLSPTANRHMLRALAQAGGGAYEFFDAKTKHNWAEKVSRQMKRMASPGCNSVSVKWQQFNPTAPPPVQAPKQLHALFNDCHTLVYGFVPHCTQATLLGNLSGQELQTMVSTSELQKTRGTFLHKLTARALIRDYEDGCLDASEAEHESKKTELKSFIVELSKEFSILSQFTSFVAIEERDSDQSEDGFTDIPKLIADEDVDFLPYISWTSPQDNESLVENELLDYEEDSDEILVAECMSEDEQDDSVSPDYTPTSCDVDMMMDDVSFFESVERKAKLSSRSRPRSPSPSSSEISSEQDMGFGLFDEPLFCSSLAQPSVSISADSDSYSPVAPFLKTKFLSVPPPPGLFHSAPPPPPPPPGSSMRPPPPVPSDYSPVSLSRSCAMPPLPQWSKERQNSAPPLVGSSPLARPSVSISADSDSYSPVAPFLKTKYLSVPPPLLFHSAPPSPPGLFHSAPPPPPGLFHSAPPPPGSSMHPPPPVPSDYSPVSLYVSRAMPPLPHPSVALPPSRSPRRLRLLEGGSKDVDLPEVTLDSGPQTSSLFGATAPSARRTKRMALVTNEAEAFDSVVVESEREAAAVAPALLTAEEFSTPIDESFSFGSIQFSSVLRQQSDFGGFHSKCAYKPVSGTALDLTLSQHQEVHQQPQTRELRVEKADENYRPTPFSFGGAASTGFGFSSASLSLGLSAPVGQFLQAQPQKKLCAEMFRQDSSFGDAVTESLVSSSASLSTDRPGSHMHDELISCAEITLDSLDKCDIELNPQEQQQLQALMFGSSPFSAAASGFGSSSASLSWVKPSPLSRTNSSPHAKSRMEKRQSTAFPRRERESGMSPALKWKRIFQLQRPEGYWELTTELGEHLKVNVDVFANVFLKNKGINSLGVKAHEDILKLVATLLVLQLMRLEECEEGKLLRTLFSLEEPSEPRSAQWEAVKRAVDWACWADRQYPCVYSRLEFGLSWESSTRQLLGYEDIPPFSALYLQNVQTMLTVR